jgi:hypothetical protein
MLAIHVKPLQMRHYQKNSIQNMYAISGYPAEKEQ